jgi:hypothetical protein
LAREIAISPVSSGWRSESSTRASNSGKFVKEQDAVMGKRYLARLRAQPAADQSRHAGRGAARETAAGW